MKFGDKVLVLTDSGEHSATVIKTLDDLVICSLDGRKVELPHSCIRNELRIEVLITPFDSAQPAHVHGERRPYWDREAVKS